MEKRSIQKSKKGAKESAPQYGAKGPLPFRTQFEPNYKGARGEINNEPSMTEPDMALSVAELLKNHARGKSIDAMHYEGEYFEDEEIPHFTDLTEMQQYKEELVKRTKELEKQIKDEQEAEQRKKDELDAEYQKILKRRENEEKADLEIESRRITKKKSSEGTK